MSTSVTRGARLLGSLNGVSAVLLCFLLAPDHHAQGQRPLEIGERIRVTAFKYVMTRHTGIYLGRSNGVLELRPAGANENIQVETESLRRLQVQRGRRGNAPIGAVVGGVPLALLAMLVYASDPADGGFKAGYMLQYGLVAGAVGAMGGALVGAYVKSDRWENVPLRQLRPAGAPPSNGFNISLRVTF